MLRAFFGLEDNTTKVGNQIMNQVVHAARKSSGLGPKLDHKKLKKSPKRKKKVEAWDS